MCRLKDLREVHRRHCLDQDQVTDDLVATQSEVQHLEAETPKLAERFRFYQELRGYVTDLVECLDEKVGSLSECLICWGGIVYDQSRHLFDKISYH